MFRCPHVNNGIIKAKDRIIVIGDLHADYNKAVKIFIYLIHTKGTNGQRY